MLVNGRANRDAIRLDGEGMRASRWSQPGDPGPAPPLHAEPARRRRPPRSLAVLPAIYFIFSRNQCDEAARAVLAAGAQLTTGDERDRIRRVVGTPRLGTMEAADLAVLGYSQFLAQLEARHRRAHHARHGAAVQGGRRGLLRRGLVKVVFATETLAVGINMPAKCVVIEAHQVHR
ncbi:MAG: hypothetical protein R2713_17650 [Ilumatobacteraceae bacterium]